jgi:hypothetical protein
LASVAANSSATTGINAENSERLLLPRALSFMVRLAQIGPAGNNPGAGQLVPPNQSLRDMYARHGNASWSARSEYKIAINIGASRIYFSLISLRVVPSGFFMGTDAILPATTEGSADS